MIVQDAIFLGRGQTIAALGGLRHRSRDYANHHITLEKHPHTGRVLRTVRLALAANVLGPDFWARASDAALDAMSTFEEPWEDGWPSEGDRWLRAGPLGNLLRCEE